MTQSQLLSWWISGDTFLMGQGGRKSWGESTDPLASSPDPRASCCQFTQRPPPVASGCHLVPTWEMMPTRVCPKDWEGGMRLGWEGGLLWVPLGEASRSSIWGESTGACDALKALCLRLFPVASICSPPGHSGTSQAYSMLCLPLGNNCWVFPKLRMTSFSFTVWVKGFQTFTVPFLPGGVRIHGLGHSWPPAKRMKA